MQTTLKEVRTGFNRFMTWPLAGSCEHSNEPSGTIAYW